MNAITPILEWVHDSGAFLKLTYDEPGDWSLSRAEREQQTVRRIRKYLHAVACRKPVREAA